MIRRSLASILLRGSNGFLPPERSEWGRAMTAELAHVADDGEALRFAAGCVGACLWASVMAAPPWIRAGRIAIALVTAVYAVFHLQAAARGISFLFGAPDPHYQLLLRRSADGAQHHLELRPFTVLLMGGTGLTHIAAAIFLVAWRPKLFVGTLGCALLCVSVFYLAARHTWPIQLLPILLLAGSGAALACLPKPERRA